MSTCKNRRLTELLGIEPTYSLPNECGKIIYPDFAADPRLVLRAMIEREDWDKFWQKLFMEQGTHPNFWVYYILNPAVLRDKAIEFLEEKK